MSVNAQRPVLLLCLAAVMPLLGRAQPADEGSVPEPTRMAVMASRLDARIATAGNLQRIDSNNATAEIAAIEISAGAAREKGVRIDLRNESGSDSVYLDAAQGQRLRDDFAHLEQGLELALQGGDNSTFGIARCRPTQHVTQAFCPAAYTTREGEWGVLVSTVEGAFQFPGRKPADFSNVLTSVIKGLDMADTVASR